MPAMAPKDKINMSAKRHYCREPSLEKISVHSNCLQQKSENPVAHHYPIVWGKG